MYDELFNSFPINLDSIGVSPSGTATISKFKKEKNSSKKYSFEFKFDKEIIPSDIIALTLGGVEMKNGQCSITFLMTTTWTCWRSSSSQNIIYL